MNSPYGRQCKENQAPLEEAEAEAEAEGDGDDDGDDDDDDDQEVFFGDITKKERSKMTKLRRQTQVFVANFRDECSSDTDESIMLTNTSYNAQWSPDTKCVCTSMGSNSPCRSQSPHESGQTLDTAVMTSPVVIVPSHTPCIMEISPQQNTEDVDMLESPQPVHECHENDNATEIVFNATDDKITSKSTSSRSQGLPLPDHLSFHEEFSSKMLPTDSEIPQSKSLSKCVTSVTQFESKQKMCIQPKMHSRGSCLNQVNVLSVSSSYASPSLLQTGPASQTSGPACQITRPVVSSAYSQVAPAFQDIPHTSLRQVSHIDVLSSYPKIDFEQIQSANVFSSPCLFPMTVQAVQSQLSIPSAVLFSPHKISDNKPNEDINHSGNLSNLSSGTQGIKSQSTPRLVEKVKDQTDCSKSPLITSSLSEDSHHSHMYPYKFSTTIDDFSMSPNISVRKSAQKVAIVTPQSAGDLLFTPDSSAKRESRCRTRFDDSPELHNNLLKPASSHQFFPSPVIMLKECQGMICSHAVTPRQVQSAGLQSGAVSSPHMERARSQAAGRKVELLEQKKAELARIRAQKAELKQTLKTENEMCFTMRRDIQAALRSNTSQTNIPVHLLSLGCQGISSLTLSDQELEIVTRIHTIRNSQHEIIPELITSISPGALHKESLHLRWHSSLVTEVHQLSSPGHPVRVARPILTKRKLAWK